MQFTIVIVPHSFPLDVQFRFMNDEIVNHGIVTITDITESEPLLFVTDRIDCCPPGDSGVSNGQWYFSDESAVPEGSEGNFYQTSAFAAVRLHRTNGMTNGIFRCDIPDTVGNVHSRHIGIYNIGAGTMFILCLHCCIVVLVKFFEIRHGFNYAQWLVKLLSNDSFATHGLR